MKCCKCGHEIKVNDEVRFCYFCGAPQEQKKTLSETGSALRKIYNDFGPEKIFSNSRYITAALGDFIPDADIITTNIESVYRAGLGKVYETQFRKGEIPNEAFYSHVRNIITEEAGLSDKRANQLIQYFDEMVGWETQDNPNSISSSEPIVRTETYETPVKPAEPEEPAPVNVMEPKPEPVETALEEPVLSEPEDEVLAALAIEGNIFKPYVNAFAQTVKSVPEPQKVVLSEAEIGSRVFFGSYEQDNSASNGKEVIEWIVLAREGDRILLISRYALDCQQFNNVFKNTTWETCSLREWLNENFLSTAFSAEERSKILSVSVRADKNPSYDTSPGKSTMDQVFLLSIKEVNKYFSVDSARECQGTVYCYAKGAYKGGNGNCCWWLRSPGDDSSSAAYVNCDGNVFYYGNYVDRGSRAVRPAMWIDIGS